VTKVVLVTRLLFADRHLIAALHCPRTVGLFMHTFFICLVSVVLSPRSTGSIGFCISDTETFVSSALDRAGLIHIARVTNVERISERLPGHSYPVRAGREALVFMASRLGHDILLK
jgi:hypothetical protein